MEQVLAKTRYEPTLFPFHFPTQIRVKVAKTSISESKFSTKDAAPSDFLESIDLKNISKFKEFREDMEYQYLKKLMSDTKGSKKEAIRLSGISRQRLYELLKKYNL